MSAADDLRAIRKKVETRYSEIFTGVVDLAHDSIQNGSPITGSPGQQVDKGDLKASWQKWYPSPNEAMIATDKPYAEQEEEGIAASGKTIVQRSKVGGPHSRALTIAGLQTITDVVTARVVGESR